MSEWKTYRLGDICTLVAGFAFKSNNFGDYPDKVIKIADIQPPIVDMSSLTGVDISQYNSQKLEKYKIQKGDYVLAMTGATIGKLGRILSEKNAYINQRVLLFKPIDKYIDKNYLYYYLCQNIFYSHIRNHIDSETAQPNISANSIGEFTLTLPPLDEQRRIAGILGSLDDKIELNRRINANLEAQAQALFRSWFVDFEPFRDGPFVDSELGKIPQGWKIGTLSEIGDVIGGGTPSKIKPEYYTDNGIAWITPKDLSTNNCKFTSKGETDISELGYKNSSAKLMPRGSVLFSSRAPIGYISIAKNEICTNQGFKSIVPKKAGTCFIYYFLRNNTSKIESMASGSTFKEASGGLMKSLEVIIPSNKILTAFEEAIQPLFNMQEHNEDENARLSALRDTLLPKLMAGEINLH